MRSTRDAPKTTQEDDAFIAELSALGIGLAFYEGLTLASQFSPNDPKRSLPWLRAHVERSLYWPTFVEAVDADAQLPADWLITPASDLVLGWARQALAPSPAPRG